MIEPGPVGGTSPGSAWLNKLRGFVLSLRILDGYGYRVRRSPSGTILEIEPPKGGGERSSGLTRKTYSSQTADYITCSDGTKVAKPDELRAVASETIDGVTYDYTDYNWTNQTRHASGGGRSEDQVITPRYLTTSKIYAATADETGVADAPTTIDQNLAGRAWAWVNDE